MKKAYRIPQENMPAIDEVLKKLNKKATKLNCPAISYEIVGSEKEEIYDDKKQIIGYRLFNLIELVGEAPIIPGWIFLGVVEFSDGAQNAPLLMMSPQAGPLDREWRQGVMENPTRCDHCHTNRRRSQTFIVYNTDNENYSLVGRSCLKDFTGHKNPQAVAAYYTMLMDLTGSLASEEGLGGGGGGGMLQAIEDFMVVVCAVARIDGFVSATRARETGQTSTGAESWGILNPWTSEEKKASRAFMSEIAKEDKEKAKKIIKFLPTLWEEKDDLDLSDFITNLRNSASTGLVSSRTRGIVAAGYLCYARHAEREALRAATKDLSQSTHQGNIGERLTLTLTCHAARETEGYYLYGLTVITKFHDDAGNVFCWFNSGRKRPEVGKTYTVTGRVKAHRRYNGTDETHLSRCTIK